jgi:transposase
MEQLLNKISNPKGFSTNTSQPVVDSNAVVNKRDYKSYPQDFKNQVIGVYKSGVYESVEDCAKAYGISNKSLYRWLKSLETKSTPGAILEQHTEMAKLKKELARAKMENEILKKAAIYFANQAQ